MARKPKAKKSAERGNAISDTAKFTADSLTVLIHGTFYEHATFNQRWVEDEEGTLAHELKRRGHNLYIHRWASSGDTDAKRHDQRVAAAKELVEKLQLVSVNKLIVITHSHGANVASIATWAGLVSGVAPLKSNVLVMLSPAVSKKAKYKGVKYWPNIDNIGSPTDRNFYNFHLNVDLVLQPKWKVNYDDTPLDSNEREEKFRLLDHWHTTRLDTWHQNAHWFDIVDPT